MKVYVLEEVDSKTRKMPESKTNYLIWVDNKLMEGQAIFNDIKAWQQSMVFIQLKSNKELEEWLDKHMEILYDDTANVVFISNMVRDGNFYAGVDAIDMIRRVNDETPIMIYVGDEAAARKNMVERKREPNNNLQVTCHA